jgi:hypothetical protein
MAQTPISLEEISASWLSEVLSERYPGTQVSSLSLEDAHAGTTGRALIRLQYDHNPGLPEHMFVKLPPTDELQRQFVVEVGMGRREAGFYRELADSLPIATPRCFYADSNAAGDRYIMLLENLEERGCSFRNASENYSLDYLRSVLAAFARLHAMFWNSPRFSTDLDWLQPPEFHPMGPILVQRALEEYSASMPAVFTALGELYVNHASDIHELWNRGTPTLVHGDCHDANLYFDPHYKDGGGPGFLDWALVSRTSCMRDVAYFLAGTPTPEDRRLHQDELLDFYFESLQAEGVTGLDRVALQQQYRWHVAYIWVGAATTLAMGSEWQPVDYVLGTLQRLNLAVADSACVEALSEPNSW